MIDAGMLITVSPEGYGTMHAAQCDESGWTLDALYDLLECKVVECLHFIGPEGKPWVVIFDEEGRLKGKPANYMATHLLGGELRHALGAPFVGHVLITPSHLFA